jgi:hypothetical protein
MASRLRQIQEALSRAASRLRQLLGGKVPRATRFEIETPLLWRGLGEMDWHKGKTENISSSGLLFKAESLMEVGRPVEVSLVLPAEVGGDSGAVVLWQGEIVRTVLSPASDAMPTLAARILGENADAEAFLDVTGNKDPTIK